MTVIKTTKPASTTPLTGVAPKQPPKGEGQPEKPSAKAVPNLDAGYYVSQAKVALQAVCDVFSPKGLCFPDVQATPVMGVVKDAKPVQSLDQVKKNIQEWGPKSAIPRRQLIDLAKKDLANIRAKLKETITPLEKKIADINAKDPNYIKVSDDIKALATKLKQTLSKVEQKKIQKEIKSLQKTLESYPLRADLKAQIDPLKAQIVDIILAESSKEDSFRTGQYKDVIGCSVTNKKDNNNYPANITGNGGSGCGQTVTKFMVRVGMLASETQGSGGAEELAMKLKANPNFECVFPKTAKDQAKIHLKSESGPKFETVEKAYDGPMGKDGKPTEVKRPADRMTDEEMEQLQEGDVLFFAGDDGTIDHVAIVTKVDKTKKPIAITILQNNSNDAGKAAGGEAGKSGRYAMAVEDDLKARVKEIENWRKPEDRLKARPAAVFRFKGSQAQ